MPYLILASTSPYRADALRRVGLKFTIQAPNSDEAALPDEDLATLPLRLAHAKAAAVATQHQDAVVIGSDQVGTLHGTRLHKPGDAATAIEQLCRLSGQRAYFHTAVAVHHNASNRYLGEVITTELEFKTFTRESAECYVQLDNPIDCAGSFKVEAAGIALFRRIVSDDPSALIGLPMIALLNQLEQFGINPLQRA